MSLLGPENRRGQIAMSREKDRAVTFVLVGVMIVLGVLGLAGVVSRTVGLVVLSLMIPVAVILTVRAYQRFKRREG